MRILGPVLGIKKHAMLVILKCGIACLVFLSILFFIAGAGGVLYLVFSQDMESFIARLFLASISPVLDRLGCIS